MSRPTIVFHWLVAASIVGMLAFGLYLEDYPRGPAREALAAWHATLGMAVLALGALRLGWRLIEGMPESLGAPPQWQLALAKLVHWFLLAAVIVMPLSGLVTTLGHGRSVDIGLVVIGPIAPSHSLAEAGEIVHATLSKLVIATLALHAAAALKHHYLDRDATLARMLGRGTR